MKKTINTNLGGFVFHIDEDGYSRLENYLNALKEKFSNANEQSEILQDIEYRLAEIFSEKLQKKLEVVSLEMVNEAINQLGEPDEIESDANQEDDTKQKSKVKKKFFRDPDDKVIGGVISGFCNFIGFEHVVLVRLAFAFLTIASVGFPGVIIYLILLVIVPEAKTTSEKLQMKGESATLQNIEEAVRKNISSVNIPDVATPGRNLARIILKVVIIVIAVIIGIKLFAATFAILTGGIALSLLSPEIIQLVFPSLLSFNLTALSAWILIAIPMIMLLLLFAKIFTKRNLHLGLSTALLGVLWFVGLFALITIAFITVAQFKVNTEKTIALDFPEQFADNLIIEVPESTQNFKFPAKKDQLEIVVNNVDFLNEEGHLIMKNVTLNVNNDENNLSKLAVQYRAYGKNLEDAENEIEKIEHQLFFSNDSTLTISPDVIMKNNPRFRNQSSIVNISLPVGKTITFNGAIKDIAGKINLEDKNQEKNLQNNTFIMTEKGLKCLTCQ